MSQKNNIVNFLIHDANGQPQVVKVVQNTSKPSVTQFKLKPSPVLKHHYTETTPQFPAQQNVKVSGMSGVSKVAPLHTFSPLPKAEIHEFEVPITHIVKTESAQELEIDPLVDLVPIAAKQNNQPSSSTSAHHKSYISNSTTKRRPAADETVPEYTTKRRKHADKVGKGLRHFSMKVCEKVRTKGFTSYNEVADELVAEFAAGIHGSPDSQYDQKNIRRRVYDALNVLMAMNIISKEKKEIRWLGLPTNSVQECNALEKEKQAKIDRIEKKTLQLQELILQHISFKSLIERNKLAETKGLKPSPSSAIHLPFIVVDTSEDALIDCSISNDKQEYMFKFNKKFQVHDDIDILKRMGLLYGLDKGKCSEEYIEKAKSMVPKTLEYFVEKMGRGTIKNIHEILEEESDIGSYEEDGDDGETPEDGADEDPDDNYSEEESSDIDV